MKAIERLGLVLVFAAGSVQACSGDSSNTDGGTDATASDASNDTNVGDAGKDVTQSEGGSCPTYGGAAQFCKDYVAHCGACGNTLSSCQTTNFTTICEGANAAFSSAYLAAITSCDTICDSDAASTCQKAAMADASLTAAQAKVATDFCAVCDGGSTCTAQVEKSYNLVELSDTVAATIDSKCTPDAASACPGYGGCVLGYFIAAFPNPCADAGN